MLHILLLVLKIIGIIIAAILGILVLLLCIVLFVPFRYEIKGRSEGDAPSLKGKIKVTWLLHLFRADVYYKDQKLIWRIRFAFWKRMAGKKGGIQNENEEEKGHPISENVGEKPEEVKSSESIQEEFKEAEEDLEEAVLHERLPGAGTQAALIQGCGNLLSRFAVGVPGEDLLHDGSRLRVDMVQPVLLANGEAQRHHTAVVLALEGVFALTARHFQGEFGGIVFRHANQHTLHHNAFRPLRDGFHGRHQMDTVLFQLVLVVHGIEPIPGKAVQLPDQNHIEDFLCAVLYHPLKVRAVIRLGRVGTVDVGADHGDTVLLGVVLAVAQLPFNGRFALAVG